MSTTVSLSIIIPSWNTAGLLTDCLNSIYSSVIKRAFEIIVVDNASTDNSVITVRKNFPETKIIINEVNLGFSKACNQGVRASRGS